MNEAHLVVACVVVCLMLMELQLTNYILILKYSRRSISWYDSGWRYHSPVQWPSGSSFGCQLIITFCWLLWFWVFCTIILSQLLIFLGILSNYVNGSWNHFLFTVCLTFDPYFFAGGSSRYSYGMYIFRIVCFARHALFFLVKFSGEKLFINPRFEFWF